MGSQEQFFSTFFRGLPDGHKILLWTSAPDGQKISHWASSASEAASMAERLSTDAHNLYFGTCSRRKDHGKHERGKATDISFIFGFWIDIDAYSESHQKQNLPKDTEEAMTILDAIPLEPSILVSSGHGLQAYWLLDQPLAVGVDPKNATAITKRFNDTFLVFAQKCGWNVDSVYDLPRVMRVPGSKNVKNRSAIEDVVILSMTDARYSIDEIEEVIIDAPLETATVARDDANLSAVVNPSAQPNFDKFEALLDNHPDFRDRWTHRKPPSSNDDSMSAYDMSIATIAAHSGWSVQEIVDLLVAHRRKYPQLDKQNKGDRAGYLISTASKAISTAHAKAAVASPQQLKKVLEVTEDGTPDITAPETQRERAEAFKHVSAMLNITITDFMKYDGDEPVFRIECIDSVTGGAKAFDIGTMEVVGSYAKFSSRVAAHTSIFPSPMKPAQWRGALTLLLRFARVLTLADGGDETTLVYNKLSSYMRNADVVRLEAELEVPVADDGDNIAYQIRGGNVAYFSLDGFCRFLHLHERENISRRLVAKALKTKKIESKCLTVRKGQEPGAGHTRRSMWLWRLE